MLTLLWRLAVVMVAGYGISGCGATLNQLPATSADAFALDPRTLDRGKAVETLTVQASADQTLTASQQALAAAGFVIEAPASTAERRCGSRESGQDEGMTWACFYVRGSAPEQTAVRVVTATPRQLSALGEGRAYPRELAAALRERLASLQAR
jgi:hypothetical protein